MFRHNQPAAGPLLAQGKKPDCRETFDLRFLQDGGDAELEDVPIHFKTNGKENIKSSTKPGRRLEHKAIHIPGYVMCAILATPEIDGV